MSRLMMIPPVLLTALPAQAHTADHVHLHDSDGLSMILGLSLIALGTGAAAYVKVRRK